MGRPPRIDAPGLTHHVFNRGGNRQIVFRSDDDRLEFGRLLGEISDIFGVRLLAYCLMDNHYHLIVQCPDGGLSDAMQTARIDLHDARERTAWSRRATV